MASMALFVARQMRAGSGSGLEVLIAQGWAERTGDGGHRFVWRDGTAATLDELIAEAELDPRSGRLGVPAEVRLPGLD